MTPDERQSDYYRFFLLPARAGAGVFLALSLCFFSCKEEQQVKTAPPAARAQPKPAARSVPRPGLNDLRALQARTEENKAGRAAIDKLLQVSFDPVSGCFFIVGTGVSNNALPRAAHRAARQKAALNTALRWALYLKAWHTGKHIAFGSPIEGHVAYHSVVSEQVRGDTLFLIVQVPVGSVELE
jgi:hypothetical protein